jgi:hypothetical protein
MSDLILYTTEDGATRLDLRIEGGTAWLTQLETAALFATTKNNVSLHVRNIFQEGELTPEATVKESLTVQIEGKVAADAEDLREIENLDKTLKKHTPDPKS